MQAILTKYLGPTDHHGARVKAVCDAGALTLSWDDALDTTANHDAAAAALARKLGWDVRLAGGTVAQRVKGWHRCYVVSP